jgi:predicted ferric reductase
VSLIVAAEEIPVSAYASKLLNRADICEGTMAFQFEKPPGFDFKPGQSVDLTLLNPPETDSEGNVRTFSIASAPFEDQLRFATRMRDTAFKRSLRKVPLGTAVKMDSAMGSFTLHKNSAKPAVFLAGGIGITPFSSGLRKMLVECGVDEDDRPTMSGLHTSCTCFIPTGVPRTRPLSKSCRIWRRQTQTSVLLPQ